MKFLIGLLLLPTMIIPLKLKANTPTFQKRCGWVASFSPGNWDFTDREGQWQMALQGVFEARGLNFEGYENDEELVGGPQKKFCACFKARVDKKKKHILEIKEIKNLPLNKCRTDKSLST
ncbi:MAG: DUF4087 domain-containing protein [Bdellovibrionales bacterium]